jgi:hypothetical protein
MGGGFGSATDSVSLPELEPGGMRQHFIVPAIRRGNVACVQWPDVRGFEHFPELLNVADDAFHVHASPIFNKNMAAVKRKSSPT